jgi:undecaprenyl diphosphate synthase
MSSTGPDAPYNDAELVGWGLSRSTLPQSVAIIMDGNGRWAVNRGKDRGAGHLAGVERVRPLVTMSARLGISRLTLYCLSSENWKRPEAELAFLMELFERFLQHEHGEILRQNIRFTVIGRSAGLTEPVIRQIERTRSASAANTGLELCLAVNYGSRGEITDAVVEIAAKVQAGKLSPAEITETTISNHLYTRGCTDPDLVIRTAGEMRLSNYLLWQVSYAELWVTETHWPDFDEAEFARALRDFASRTRRFGGLAE